MCDSDFESDFDTDSSKYPCDISGDSEDISDIDYPDDYYYPQEEIWQKDNIPEDIAHEWGLLQKEKDVGPPIRNTTTVQRVEPKGPDEGRMEIPRLSNQQCSSQYHGIQQHYSRFTPGDISHNKDRHAD